MESLAADVLSKTITSLVESFVKVAFSKTKKYIKDLSKEIDIDFGQAYIDYLQRAYVKHSKIKTLLYRQEPKDLYSFYVCAGVAIDRKIVDPTLAMNLLKHGKRLVITGTGGIGKSILFKHLFLNSVTASKNIPVLLELRGLNIDQLTGLFSRQYLRDKYEGAIKCAARTALLFIDVDDFKNINDSYGHLVGDEVLRELAACIKNNVRVANDAIRFGGDEFVIVLENTSAEEAYLVAERIRSCAGELEFYGAESIFHITLSIGLIEGAAPLDELLEKADRAMYASKNKGKNKTTVFSEKGSDGSFHMKLK